jgi:hypothetical protein
MFSPLGLRSIAVVFVVGLGAAWAYDKWAPDVAAMAGNKMGRQQ